MFYCSIIQHQFKNICNKKNIAAYCFGASAAIAFVAFRLINKGWIQTHVGSPWEDLWHMATPKIFLFNVVVLAHRVLDFGRIAVVFFIAITSIYYYKNKIKYSPNTLLLLAFAILSTCIITIVSLAATNTIAHRYYAISFVFLHLLALLLLNQLITYKKTILLLLAMFLITGNMWHYPNKIAQGWDASLRGLPYFNLRKKAITYLDERHIKIEEVGSFFPNNFSIEEVSVNGDNRKFANFDSTNHYVFYANVYNLNNSQYQQLEQLFVPVKIFKAYGIYVAILKKK
jgi:hypothetical protein